MILAVALAAVVIVVAQELIVVIIDDDFRDVRVGESVHKVFDYGFPFQISYCVQDIPARTPPWLARWLVAGNFVFFFVCGLAVVGFVRCWRGHKLIVPLAALLLAGCVTTGTRQSADSRILYPNAIYRYSDSVVMIPPKERQDYGVASSDPFLTKKVTAIHYWYKDGKDEAGAYFESLLPSLGWKKIRGQHPVEQTLCGGDWVGVYEKDRMMFKIHACGSSPIPPEAVDDTYKGNFLTYYFYRTRPESVLGGGYRQNDLTMRASGGTAGSGSP